MSSPVVGQTLTTLQLTSLPSGTRVERAVDGWVVTEVPPQVSERDQVAKELVSYFNQFRLDNGYDETWEYVLADYILTNYVRKGAGVTFDAQIPGQPAAVIDEDGDRWERQPDGTYTMRRSNGELSQSYDYRGQTLDQVRERFGPLRDAA